MREPKETQQRDVQSTSLVQEKNNTKSAQGALL